MSKLKAAIAGAGLIAGKKHIPAFVKQNGKVEIVALCDLNLEAAQKAANDFGIRRAYSNFSEMLSNERPDLVDICTPPQTHAKLAVEAMRGGAHILIEKPMALSVVDCDAIVSASREYGKKVCVAHSALFYWPFVEARQLVEKGAIGQFRGMRIWLCTPTDYMTSNEKHWAHKLPGGVVGETGPHVVYMSQAFINPIRSVSVDALKVLEYPWSRYDDYRINLIGDRAMSSITLTYTSNQWAARADILGTEGIITLDLLSYLVKTRRPTLKPLTVVGSLLSESAQVVKSLLRTSATVLRGRYSTHNVIVERFIESILNGIQPPVTAEEGREAVRILGMIAEQLNRRKVATLV